MVVVLNSSWSHFSYSPSVANWRSMLTAKFLILSSATIVKPRRGTAPIIQFWLIKDTSRFLAISSNEDTSSVEATQRITGMGRCTKLCVRSANSSVTAPIATLFSSWRQSRCPSLSGNVKLIARDLLTFMGSTHLDDIYLEDSFTHLGASTYASHRHLILELIFLC